MPGEFQENATVAHNNETSNSAAESRTNQLYPEKLPPLEEVSMGIFHDLSRDVLPKKRRLLDTQFNGTAVQQFKASKLENVNSESQLSNDLKQNVPPSEFTSPSSVSSQSPILTIEITSPQCTNGIKNVGHSKETKDLLAWACNAVGIDSDFKDLSDSYDASGLCSQRERYQSHMMQQLPRSSCQYSVDNYSYPKMHQELNYPYYKNLKQYNNNMIHISEDPKFAFSGPFIKTQYQSNNRPSTHQNGLDNGMTNTLPNPHKCYPQHLGEIGNQKVRFNSNLHGYPLNESFRENAQMNFDKMNLKYSKENMESQCRENCIDWAKFNATMPSNYQHSNYENAKGSKFYSRRMSDSYTSAYPSHSLYGNIPYSYVSPEVSKDTSSTRTPNLHFQSIGQSHPNSVNHSSHNTIRNNSIQQTYNTKHPPYPNYYSNLNYCNQQYSYTTPAYHSEYPFALPNGNSYQNSTSQHIPSTQQMVPYASNRRADRSHSWLYSMQHSNFDNCDPEEYRKIGSNIHCTPPIRGQFEKAVTNPKVSQSYKNRDILPSTCQQNKQEQKLSPKYMEIKQPDAKIYYASNPESYDSTFSAHRIEKTINPCLQIANKLEVSEYKSRNSESPTMSAHISANKAQIEYLTDKASSSSLSKTYVNELHQQFWNTKTAKDFVSPNWKSNYSISHKLLNNYSATENVPKFMDSSVYEGQPSVFDGTDQPHLHSSPVSSTTASFEEDRTDINDQSTDILTNNSTNPNVVMMIEKTCNNEKESTKHEILPELYKVDDDSTHIIKPACAKNECNSNSNKIILASPIIDEEEQVQKQIEQNRFIKATYEHMNIYNKTEDDIPNSDSLKVFHTLQMHRPASEPSASAKYTKGKPYSEEEVRPASLPPSLLTLNTFITASINNNNSPEEAFMVQLNSVLDYLLQVPEAASLRNLRSNPDYLLEKLVLQWGGQPSKQKDFLRRIKQNFAAVVRLCMSTELLMKWGWNNCSPEDMICDLLKCSNQDLEHFKESEDDVPVISISDQECPAYDEVFFFTTDSPADKDCKQETLQKLP